MGYKMEVTMSFKDVFVSCCRWNERRKIFKTSRFQMERDVGELIRNTHSIEKGLSISNPRLGFGHSKQLEMLKLIDRLKNIDNPLCRTSCSMAYASLFTYVNYHKEKGFTDSCIETLQQFLKNNEDISMSKEDGGILSFGIEDLNYDLETIKKLFYTRHSIRDFDSSEVDYGLVEKAIVLAQRCPSACNRQGTRVYVIKTSRAKECLVNWLNGIGGFQKEVKGYLLVTSKVSMYRKEEYYQHIVSSSIFTGYLTLALHAYKIGACVIQRVPIWNHGWDVVRRQLDIPEDEQVICAIGIGNIKQNCSVPVSHRLPLDIFLAYK